MQGQALKKACPEESHQASKQARLESCLLHHYSVCLSLRPCLSHDLTYYTSKCVFILRSALLCQQSISLGGKSDGPQCLPLLTGGSLPEHASFYCPRAFCVVILPSTTVSFTIASFGSVAHAVFGPSHDKELQQTEVLTQRTRRAWPVDNHDHSTSPPPTRQCQIKTFSLHQPGLTSRYTASWST